MAKYAAPEFAAFSDVSASNNVSAMGITMIAKLIDANVPGPNTKIPSKVEPTHNAAISCGF